MGTGHCSGQRCRDWLYEIDTGEYYGVGMEWRAAMEEEERARRVIDDVMSQGWFLWAQRTSLGILMGTWSCHLREGEKVIKSR